jgi:SAM-dependent methyltransferase
MNEREYEKIPRGQRNKCWCGGELGPFKWHTSYGVCADCGCYVNRYPPLPEALERVYSLNLHWRARQKIKGHLPIEARSGLYRSEGRLDYWLSLVEKYGPRRGRAIEVGCSPGVLLAELQQRGFECVGVEPDYKVAQWIQDHFGVEVRKGLFPGVELPPCDLFLALDVAEHVPDPAAFWTELARLLRPGGVAILQTPVERYDYDHPFRSRPDLLDDVEHLFLYTDRSVYRLADHARLEMVCLEDAIGTLGQICVLSKPERSSTLRS